MGAVVDFFRMNARFGRSVRRSARMIGCGRPCGLGGVDAQGRHLDGGPVGKLRSHIKASGQLLTKWQASVDVVIAIDYASRGCTCRYVSLQQRKPRWLVVLRTACPCRAAGR